jgi:hypothetical protein
VKISDTKSISKLMVYRQGGRNMRRVFVLSLLVMVASVFMAASALAEKPEEVMGNSNGFPSGEHFNLNIIGKKDGFNPQEGQTDGTTDSYGNVVFVPENGEGAIYMESGKGKKFEEVLQLRVLDNWAGDTDGARLQLPKNEAGYRVYARALGKPGDLTSIGLTPGLGLVQDENGDNLYYLGWVTDSHFETENQVFERRKGKSKAIDISPLFKWSGEICYFFEEDPGEGYSPTEICCIRTDTATGQCLSYEFLPEGSTLCPGGLLPIEVYCKQYTEVPWIFNIAAFVEYLWTTDNKGTKLLSVRFYPN